MWHDKYFIHLFQRSGYFYKRISPLKNSLVYPILKAKFIPNITNNNIYFLLNSSFFYLILETLSIFKYLLEILEIMTFIFSLINVK